MLPEKKRLTFVYAFVSGKIWESIISGVHGSRVPEISTDYTERYCSNCSNEANINLVLATLVGPSPIICGLNSWIDVCVTIYLEYQSAVQDLQQNVKCPEPVQNNRTIPS